MDLIDKRCIKLEVDAKNKNDLFDEMIGLLYDADKITCLYASHDYSSPEFGEWLKTIEDGEEEDLDDFVIYMESLGWIIDDFENGEYRIIYGCNDEDIKNIIKNK